MTWKQLLINLLLLRKSPDDIQEIEQAILDGVPAGEFSAEEAVERVNQLRRYSAAMISGKTILVETTSHSMYELHTELRLVRRLKGQGNPTPRVGVDGKWRQYDSISCVNEQETQPAPPFTVGYRMLIQWPAWTPLLPDSEGDVPSTLTSPILSAVLEGDVLS